MQVQYSLSVDELNVTWLDFSRCGPGHAQEFFPSAFESVTVDQLYAAENVVKDPSYIRVESDEV